MYSLYTERLQIRPLHAGDAPFFLRLLNSPGWIKYIGDRQVHTEEAAAAYITERIAKGYAKGDFGFQLVELREDNTPLGICGVIKRDELDAPDIGFAFLPEYFGKGYAFESTEAVFNYARYTLGIPTILGITLAENVASIRLLEKIGLRFSRTIQMDDEELLLYSTA